MNSTPMNKIYSILTAAALAAIIWTGCSTATESNTDQGHAADGSETHETGQVYLTADQQKLANIKLGKATRQVVEQTISCTGEVGVPPYSLASVYAPVAAFVKDVSLLEGEHITKGQVLVTLQHPEIIKMQQDYVAAKSQFDYLASDLKRKETLIEKEATSQKNYEAAKADYLNMKAQVDGLAAQLTMIGIDVKRLDKAEIQTTVSLRAPISGYLSKVLVNRGKYVRADDMLFEIVDNSHLHVEAMVFQQHAAKVKEGQAMRFKATGSNTWLTGEVHLVNKKFDADKRTVNIHGHPDEGGSDDLIPGSFLDVQIVVQADTGLAVPASAVFTEGANTFLYLKGDGDQFIKQSIEPMAHNDDWYIVGDELAGKQIVIDGGYYLKGSPEGGAHSH